ncbi:ovochymase-2-like isoform X1 [Styela clava]
MFRTRCLVLIIFVMTGEHRSHGEVAKHQEDEVRLAKQSTDESSMPGEYNTNEKNTLKSSDINVNAESLAGHSAKELPAVGRSSIIGTASAANVTCGQPTMRSNISAQVDGQPSKTVIEKWPWQASIWRFNSRDGLWGYRCTGALIGRQWVLTVAQCYDEQLSSGTLVSFGKTNLLEANNGWIAAGTVLCHSGYNKATRENDICLIKLAKEVTYSESIMPACLPNQSDRSIVGEDCVITGWNRITTTVHTLHEAKVEILQKERCSTLLGDKKDLPSSHICAGHDNQITGPCLWMIGDPLVCNGSVRNMSSYTLMGLTSLNVSGCDSSTNRPGGFTDVTKYYTWINTTMKNSPDSFTCFDASTILPCGSEINTNGTIVRSPVTSTSAWIYPKSTTCSWNITAPVAHKIKLEFLCLSTETASTSNGCDDDYVRIEKGEGGRHTYCSSFNSVKEYVTKSNKASLIFHSDDDDLTAQGFTAKVTFIPPTAQEISTCFNETTIHECGTVITENNTLIRSPVGDNTTWYYPSGIDCEWDVQAPKGHIITFEFLCDFNTYNEQSDLCNKDYLNIKPLGYTTGGTYCGPHEIINPYETRGNSAKVKFHSEPNTKESTGFVVKAIFVKPSGKFEISTCFNETTIHECGTVITENNTLIRSPVGDNTTWYYPSGIDCEWDVQAPKGHIITFEFLCDFNTYNEQSDGCNKDYLNIKPLGYTTGRTYCGPHEIINPYETRGNSAKVKFHSELNTKESTGFVVKAIFVKPSGKFVISQDRCYNQSDIGQCGEYIRENNTVIRSPVVDTSTWLYPPNTDCSWNVQAPKGCNITFHFECFLHLYSPYSFSTSCADDYLLIKSPKVIRGQKYCGEFSYQKPYSVPGNTATLEFHSERNSKGARGFVIQTVFTCGGVFYFSSVKLISTLFLISLYFTK